MADFHDYAEDRAEKDGGVKAPYSQAGRTSDSFPIRGEMGSPETSSLEDGKLDNKRVEDDSATSSEGLVNQEVTNLVKCDIDLSIFASMADDEPKISSTDLERKSSYFYYDVPFVEDTGAWIPVSVPPMSESEHEEWTRGFPSSGGYYREVNMGWNQCFGEEKDLTMWDVVVEMLLAAKGKVSSITPANPHTANVSGASSGLLEEAWNEMVQTLTETNCEKSREILEMEPPKWLPDSASSYCMLCGVRFHPILYSRHHCRFCGGIFCGDCSRGRSLLPPKFRRSDPQRVCDVCCVRLEAVKPYLMDHVSRAAQLPTHDLMDLSTLRSWLNFPWGKSLEYEIYKATNIIQNYTSKVAGRKIEKAIPDFILNQAKGIAVVTVAKVGAMIAYNIGAGLVIARRNDGSWSPPLAISSFGVGWGAQAGGEVTDFIIVLRTEDAVKTFSGYGHFSLGAGLSAAMGITGRTVGADFRAGDGGHATCYTYSCSKGLLILHQPSSVDKVLRFESHLYAFLSLCMTNDTRPCECLLAVLLKEVSSQLEHNRTQSSTEANSLVVQRFCSAHCPAPPLLLPCTVPWPIFFRISKANMFVISLVSLPQKMIYAVKLISH